MGEIAFSCPACGQSYQLDAGLAGKKVRCKACAQVVRLEAPAVPAVATAADPPALGFPCPNCGHGFRLSPEVAGKRARCKKCGAIFKIPASGEPEDSGYALEETASPLPASSPVPRPAASVVPPSAPPSTRRPGIDGDEPRASGATEKSSSRARTIGLVAVCAALSLALFALLPRAWNSFQSMMGSAGSPNDSAAGADPELDMADVAPDRLDLVRQHQQVLGELADAYFAMAGACNRMRNPAQFETSRNDLMAASKRMGDVAGRGSKLPPLKPAEKAALAMFVNERVYRSATQALRAVNELMKTPGIQGNFESMRQAITQMIQQVGKEYPGGAGQPAVLLVMGKVPDGASKVIMEKARPLTDSPTGVGMGWRTDNDRSELRISPVLSAEAFARSINFGKVRRVQGRRIELDVDPPSAEEIARSNQAERRPEAPPPQPTEGQARKDSEPPAAGPPPADSAWPSIAGFQWRDADSDLIGTSHDDGARKPNGTKDQHFVLEMNFPAKGVLEEMTVFGEGPDVWVTKPDSFHWPLAVRHGDAAIAHPGPGRLGEFSGKQSFDLYGNTNTESKPGSTYKLEAVVSVGGVRRTLRSQYRRP
ncbi:hypothetical protein [Aquisphaera insulae]|uniref:hypothetical protein n=1 Tax=Aquisphaera insulae TaxID=2712864 RepID=UPI0013EBFBE0|nr:hypothetical protein [Aquisphaera insulae]